MGYDTRGYVVIWYKTDKPQTTPCNKSYQNL